MGEVTESHNLDKPTLLRVTPSERIFSFLFEQIIVVVLSLLSFFFWC